MLVRIFTDISDLSEFVFRFLISQTVQKTPDFLRLMRSQPRSTLLLQFSYSARIGPPRDHATLHTTV